MQYIAERESHLKTMKSCLARLSVLYPNEIQESGVKIKISDTKDIPMSYITASYDSYLCKFTLSSKLDFEQPEDNNVFFQISFRDTPMPFDFWSGKRSKAHFEFNVRWIDYCETKISEAKNTVDYFLRENYKVASDEGISQDGVHNFTRDVKGILAMGANELHILEVKHIREGDLYRAYSYCLFDPDDYCWRIYPVFAGLDSGGGHIAFDEIQALLNELNSSCKLNLTKLSEDEDLFKKRFGLDDNFILKDSLLLYIPCSLVDFSVFVQKITSFLEDGDYISSIAEMRVLINTLLKDLCDYYEIERKGDENLLKLWGFLVKKEILGADYISSLNTFTFFANRTHHDLPDKVWRDLPTIKNKESFLLSIVFAGRCLIIYLLDEISSIKKTHKSNN